MSFSLNISYKGIKGAENALKQFPVEITDEMTNFLQDVGETVYQQMISLVPVDTGALRDSIDYNVEGDGTLNFEATEDYAGFVEYGTTKMDPQPFFNPPLDTLGE